MKTQPKTRKERILLFLKKKKQKDFCFLAASIVVLVAAAPVGEIDGFRMDHYRAAVPDTLRGATVVHTAELQKMLATVHPLLIDVLPFPSPPPDPRPGLPRLPLPHDDIPGSVWLPETGRGALAPQTEAWFRDQLASLTHADKNTPVVFYCLSSCWMSWNAAKRAVLYGYTHVIWYPDGADGWSQQGLPVTKATPVPPPQE